MSKCILYLIDGFEEIEALAVIDILRRGEVEVETVSVVDTVEVCGAHGIKVIADKQFGTEEYENADMIILPGGPGSPDLLKINDLKEKILKLNSAGKYIAAICAAPMVLGQYGILRNKQATCYPGFETYLEGAELAANRVCVDGNIITSKGPGTAIEFALKLLEILTTKRNAEDVKKGMLYI